MASEIKSRDATFRELIEEGVLLVGDGYRAKNEELGGDGPIFLRAGHVTDERIEFEGADRFKRPSSVSLAAKLAVPGDVVVTTKGWSTGRVAYVRPTDPPFVYSPHLSFWRSLAPGVLLPGFLRHWSRSSECQEQVAAFRMAADVHPYLSLAAQRHLRIRIPPIEVQRDAAGILSTLDDKIELNRRTNETLEAMARAVFADAFLASSERSETTVEQLISNETLSIGDGYRAKNEELGSEGPSFVRAGDIYGDEIVPSVERLLPSRVMHAGEKLSRPGDVVFTSKGTVGRFAFVRSEDEQVVYSPQLCYWRVSNLSRLEPLYLFHWMKSTEFVSQLDRVKGQTDMADYVSLRDQRRMSIHLPTAERQRWFVGLVGPLDARVGSNRRESETLVALRDTLLPRLLSGELRTADAEKRLAMSS